MGLRQEASGVRNAMDSDHPSTNPPNAGAPPSPLLARNVEAVAQVEAAELARRTAAERFSDAIARMAGSVWFVGVHVVWFAAWIVCNTRLLPGRRPLDPFPFSFLTLSYLWKRSFSRSSC